MMADGHEFGDLMEARASLLPRRSWRFLLAHDASAATCKSLKVSVERALGDVDIVDTASVEHAMAELRDSTFDACFVCLDLPPVPTGGARLAQKMMRERHPVVLVTRSLRWLPANAIKLREVPWVPPDAPPSEIARAVRAALLDAVQMPAGLAAAEREAAAVASGRR
jgi:hypothetical protein